MKGKNIFLFVISFVLMTIFSANSIVAEWTESLNDGLVLYYDMENATETVNGINNITIVQGSPSFMESPDCINGKCVNINYTYGGNPNNRIGINTSKYMGSQDETINIWFSEYIANPPYYDWGIFWLNPLGARVYRHPVGQLVYNSFIGFGINNISITVSKQMLTIKTNSSGSFSYLNGILDGNGMDINMSGFFTFDGIGDERTGGQFIDEVGFWNRGLTNREIQDLWNNGTGLFYSADFQNETTNQTTMNQTAGFWNLSDTKLFPSSLSYLLGIGTSTPRAALDVIGSVLVSNTLNVTNKVYIGNNGGLQLGTQDAFGRNQIWNFLPSSILRLGSLASDGDTQTVSSEGIVVYGQNIQGDNMSSPDFGYARIKPNRIGLYSSQDDIADYYFRVDSTSLYLKNNSFIKTFEVTRSNGNTFIGGNLNVTGITNTEIGYSVNHEPGITDNAGFWMCKDVNCSSTCQADIKGGIIVGCD